MLDNAFLACFEFLDAIAHFYFTMLDTSLTESVAWTNTQEFISRVFKELEMISNESGEEYLDAGFIWSSMCIANKVVECQCFRWSEHPVIIPMLMHFVLERLGQHWTQSDESAVVSKALEKLQITNELLEDLMKTQKKDHETAANTLNQIQQLKKSLKASKKESDGDGKPIP